MHMFYANEHASIKGENRKGDKPLGTTNGMPVRPKRKLKGNDMLPSRAADTLHDPGNHVDFQSCVYSGRRNLCRKGQKTLVG